MMFLTVVNTLTYQYSMNPMSIHISRFLEPIRLDIPMTLSIRLLRLNNFNLLSHVIPALFAMLSCHAPRHAEM
jgi:hypothetical protein